MSFKQRVFAPFSVFETTIRYVGGLLSAYELSDRQHSVLLQKAKELGDKLAFSWVGVRLSQTGSVLLVDQLLLT